MRYNASRGPRDHNRPSGRSGRLAFDLPVFCSRLGKALGIAFPEPGRLVERQIDWSDERSFLITYLYTEMLSKFDDGKPSPDRDRVTWERFWEAEASCSETNHRLATPGYTSRHQQIIVSARERIARMLGTFSWDSCEPFMGWGPGASTRLRRREADAAYKYSGKPETTCGNSILGYTAICRIPSWKRDLSVNGEEGLELVTIVPGNRVITVPKNYKTDRTIAVEPCLNMYIQRGIGGVIRRRLALWGCNLNDQSRNQELALQGARSNELATIDLKMASDTISREVVRLLLPPDWVKALEQCRSPFGVLPSGEKHFYQKFSSMGNGFTFELESMIFLALARTVVRLVEGTERHVSVYGDDIIVPSTASGLLCEVLQELGFTPNPKKTFSDGPFRESCGKHYFFEQDVTPFYVRKPVQTIDRLFLLHNNLWRWVQRSRLCIGEEAFESVLELLASIRALAPSRWRKVLLPDGFGDGAFIGDVSSLSLTPCKWGWEFWQSRALVRSSVELDCEVPGLVLKALRKLERPASSSKTLEPMSSILPTEAGRMKEIKILLPWSLSA